eukprot:27387-Chlamydomonas_euryale.AAC.3
MASVARTRCDWSHMTYSCGFCHAAGGCRMQQFHVATCHVAVHACVSIGYILFLCICECAGGPGGGVGVGGSVDVKGRRRQQVSVALLGQHLHARCMPCACCMRTYTYACLHSHPDMQQHTGHRRFCCP